MVGKVLGSRYEIIEKIGTGGMSVVYKAKCRLLNRYVAVKILRPEFIDNEDFIKRFRIEAQAAASLSHPNIVSIYDVGSQDDSYYIVMEYVDGVTLKEYIVHKKVLNWNESVKIAMQICSALEHAHKNGIVHRDIKPHNIIITTDGTAKVTDFGIARAATYFTVTYAGNAIGSVHYFSPEQARGGYTDNKSDIYSLGVVLYEMLTGVVPFEGDTPVSVAFKHIQDIPIPPKDITDSIPSSLNKIILKAMAKEVEKRYQSAVDMLKDLDQVIKNPENIEVGTIEENDKGDSPTLVIPAVNISKNVTNNKEEVDMKNKQNKTKIKNKKMLYSAMFLSIIIVGMITFFSYKFIFSRPSTASETVVPNLIGRTEEEAMEMASKANITPVVKARRNDNNISAGIVIEQTPGAGLSVKIPNEVLIVVSSGKIDVKIPSIEKKDYREAQVKIEGLGLVPKINYESSETIPIGFVTRVVPSIGSAVKQGTEVEIFISNGPDSNTFPMPNLIGMNINQAKNMLKSKGLESGNVTYIENSKPYGTIVEQDIAYNTAVTSGIKVNLKLSTGNAQTYQSTKTITLSLPRNKESVNVEVKFITSKGSSIVYPSKNISTDESPLTIKVSGQGKGRLQVYFDGKLDSEQDIDFGGDR